MALLNEETASELVDGMRAARNAAHDLMGAQLTRSRAKLRSASKTRKSALTRRRIMDAASELMVERGSTNFQMSEVSERCNMSKGSLYYYFRDRDELIGAIFDEYVDEQVQGMEKLAATSTSARDALSALYREFSSRLQSATLLSLALTYELPNETDASVLQVNSRFARASNVIAAQLERGKAEGFVRQDVNCEAAAVFALGGLIVTTLAVAARDDADVEGITKSLMELMLHGVGVG